MDLESTTEYTLEPNICMLDPFEIKITTDLLCTFVVFNSMKQRIGLKMGACITDL